ncbi:HNH endonuclease [Tenacibaculum finnmarkense]|uniref:HNH endonuclease n=1 Tax=Tenacibaculum finnmarkense TaxID=2781243 RepID=UPI001E642B86|nr:HNH endonuclease [Tenacibaculum finnmarkense]MCD8403891.1 HNH endonuclease [Tenacibaculum finnmarkense genomovar finnmarkense]
MTKEQENRFLILFALRNLENSSPKNEVLNFLLENDLIKLTDYDFEILDSRNEERWRNELAFVRSHLVKSGHLQNNKRNQWELTKLSESYYSELNSLINENTFRINKEALKAFKIENKDVVNEKREIYKVKNKEKLSETEKENIILSRIGQGIFRKGLIKLYGKCCLSGFEFEKLLIASHIKPWKFSNNTERLDKYNGLLLQPTFDKLFDLGYITFSNLGKIKISSQIKDLEVLGLTEEMKIVIHEKSFDYMEYHRKNIFVK